MAQEVAAALLTPIAAGWRYGLRSSGRAIRIVTLKNSDKAACEKQGHSCCAFAAVLLVPLCVRSYTSIHLLAQFESLGQACGCIAQMLSDQCPLDWRPYRNEDRPIYKSVLSGNKKPVQAVTSSFSPRICISAEQYIYLA